jgi:hypothetical protein
MCFDPLSLLAIVGGGSAAAGAGAGAAVGGAAAAGSGLGTALSLLGTGLSVVGGIQAGQQAEKVGEYNAKVSENNALADQQRAQYEAGLIRDDKKRILGTQLAAQAANGLSVSSGSPVAVLGDTAGNAEMDVLARLYGGESSAVANQNSAALSRAEGKAQKSASIIGAGTTLLTGLGKMAGNRQALRYGV